MSYDFDDDGTEQTSTGKGNGLRAQLEAALAELKQVKEQNETLAGKVKQSDLSTLLNERKVPANVRKWMGDVEPTATAVDKWIADNASDFGWKPGGSESTDTAQTQEGQQATPEEAPAAPAVPSILTPEDAAALERLANLHGSGLLVSQLGQSQLADQQATAVQTVADNLGDELDFDKALAGLKNAGIDIGGSN